MAEDTKWEECCRENYEPIEEVGSVAAPSAYKVECAVCHTIWTLPCISSKVERKGGGRIDVTCQLDESKAEAEEYVEICGLGWSDKDIPPGIYRAIGQTPIKVERRAGAKGVPGVWWRFLKFGGRLEYTQVDVLARKFWQFGYQYAGEK